MRATDKNSTPTLDGLLTERRALSFIAECGSKIVAALTVILAAAVIFADVSFASVGTVSYTSTLLVLLVSTYLMYFSLEDVGERAGEETDEARAAILRYNEVKKRIKPDAIGALRKFLAEYSAEELSFRQKTVLAAGGLSEDDLVAYLDGKQFCREERRVLRRAARQRASILTPATVLTGMESQARGELENPEKRKFIGLALRLIPTSVCMLFTVSLALSAKDGLTASTVLDGIFKLSSLPLAGLRGYRAGYIFARYTRTAWCEVKTRVLEAFLSEGSKD